MISNYFLDNFKNYQFKIDGEIKRKLKVDLSLNYNFVVKSERQDSWNDRTQYNLYINGDINNYNFIDLSLNGKMLQANYTLNGLVCSQCIGWNQKASDKAKYHDFEDAYNKIKTYIIDDVEMENHIKNLLKAYKNYKKAIEIERTYTTNDYKKMSLSSGTTEEENKIILKNNGFDITGI